MSHPVFWERESDWLSLTSEVFPLSLRNDQGQGHIHHSVELLEKGNMLPATSIHAFSTQSSASTSMHSLVESSLPGARVDLTGGMREGRVGKHTDTLGSGGVGSLMETLQHPRNLLGHLCAVGHRGR